MTPFSRPTCVLASSLEDILTIPTFSGPDDKCRTILRNTVNAAEKGYSRFLINEWVLLDQGSPWLPAAMDINMMAQLSGMERTEGHWRELLGSVGLNIVKIWGLGPDNESLIEAALE